MIIGVTGKSGSGKTTLSKEIARNFGGKWIDMDQVCHEALNVPTNISYLCKKCGTNILGADGTINRKKLGEIVFSDETKMQELQHITWSYMEQIVDEVLEKRHDNLVILDAIRLPETKYWQQCDIKILAIANETERKEQVMKRDNITEEYFQQRDSSSISYSTEEFDLIYECHYQQQDLTNFIQKLKDSLSV